MSSKENIIELEGIEFKCFSLIEYSSLCQLLKLLAKKYKDLEKKMGILDGRMIEKDKRISELEIMLKGASQSKDDQFPSVSKDTSGDQGGKKKGKKEEKKAIKDDFLDDDYNNEKDTDTDKNKGKKDDKTKKEKESENGEDLKDESQKALSKAESDLNKSLNEEKEKDDNDFDNKKDNEEDNKEDEDDGKEFENGGKKDQEDKVITQGNKTVITDISKRGTDAENQNDLLNTEGNKRRNAEIVEQKELINKIMKKLKAHDKQINDLIVKSNEHAIMNKNIKKNKNDIEDINKKLAAMKAI